MAKSSDPTMEHEAVKFYRDTFRKCPNYGFRKDIIATVSDLELWKNILTNWRYYDHIKRKWVKRNPMDVKAMLRDYELRSEAKPKPKRREYLPVYPELRWPKINNL